MRLASWSLVCLACLASKALGHDTSAHVDAIRDRASFLSSKTIPVDAFKMRNSLYLTQPLRTPSQAAVNIVEREDMAKMQREARYLAMEARRAELDRQFDERLSEMSAMAHF
mmetsp:Transcript_56534/g.163905  ORF Transcript_56534/g.163905 Transcript_56534/m.163905 type:complete len:112 (+) Transcript_56534:65-400(+)